MQCFIGSAPLLSYKKLVSLLHNTHSLGISKNEPKWKEKYKKTGSHLYKIKNSFFLRTGTVLSNTTITYSLAVNFAPLSVLCKPITSAHMPLLTMHFHFDCRDKVLVFKRFH